MDEYVYSRCCGGCYYYCGDCLEQYIEGFFCENL